MKNESRGVEGVVQASSTLDVSCPSSLLPRFFFLLQAGFRKRVAVDCSVEELLCGHLGLDSGYVSERISTLFLDGQPVDDFQAAMVREGSILALSGALPGLVGATMRRGGFYACLRDGISYRTDTEVAHTGAKPATGIITLKLFNLVLQDLAPRFLKTGILVDGGELMGLLGRQATEFWAAAPQFVLDGEAVAGEALRSGKGGLPGQSVFLRVIPTD